MKASLKESLQAIRLKTIHETVLNNPYTPHNPSDKQFEFLFYADILEGFYGGAAGGGKALWIGTPIKTTRGWITMGDVTVGDIVYAPDGNPIKVLACSEIMTDRTCYELVFSDGAKIIADAEHEWITMDVMERQAVTRRNEDHRENRKLNRPRRSTGCRPDLVKLNRSRKYEYLKPSLGTLRTTAEIANNVKHKGSRTNHSIEVCNPLKRPYKEMPLDPYVLGVWLGDGSTNAGNITSADPEIISEIENAGFFVNKHNGAEYSYGIHGLVTKLKSVGVFGNKHIPEDYLNTSIDQRVALLQGLMDTDGTVTKLGYPEIQLTKKKLINGIIELLISLGIKATVRTGRAKLYGKDCGAKYRIKFVTDIPVFRLERKLHYQKRDKFRGTHKTRYIKEVNPIHSVPVCCIKVDSEDGMFLIGKELISTHNSDALLMAALQFVQIPNYAAILFRRTFTDLALPEALMDRTEDWLSGTDARWHEKTKTWEFPSGATLTFAYLEHERDKFRYQGAAFQFIGFDELTQFSESQYSYLFSRLRRLEGSAIPLRMRAASNPGDIGHDWVKARFITPNASQLHEDKRYFIPALLEDNPHIDVDSYEQSLNKLDPITREQLRRGNWDVGLKGGLFETQWFKVVELPPVGTSVRAWDLAATEQKGSGDPDWTVGLLMTRTDMGVCISDIQRVRKNAGEVEALIKQTAWIDGHNVQIFMEQEPGSSGKGIIAHYARDVLQGFTFYGIPSTGSKVVRAQPLSAAASNGLVSAVNAGWLRDFLTEMAAFPEGVHDDMVDSASLAYSQLYDPRPEPIDSPLPAPSGGSSRFAP